MYQIGNMFEPAVLLTAVEQAADGIVITDVDGTIQYVNPAFTTMTGYTSDEAVGQSTRILKSGHHLGTFYEDLWTMIRSGKTWNGEVVNRRKDGSFYTEEMRIAPIRISECVITGYIAIKRDVTAKRALEEKQAFLAAIVENSEDSIIACSLAGIIVAFNRGAEKIFGYRAAEVIDQHMSILVPSGHRAVLEQLAQKLAQGNSFSQYEGVCRHKDGRDIQVSLTGFPVKNSAGEVIAISNILRDITQRKLVDTERKRTEQALLESEHRFRSMADGCPSFMWVTGPAGEVEFINRVYRSFWGVTLEQMQRCDWQLSIHPDDEPEYISAFRGAVTEHASRRRVATDWH